MATIVAYLASPIFIAFISFLAGLITIVVYKIRLHKFHERDFTPFLSAIVLCVILGWWAFHR